MTKILIDRKLVEFALEALRHVVRQAQENLVPTIHYGPVHDAMNRLEAALAKPVQEPATLPGPGLVMCPACCSQFDPALNRVEPVQEPAGQLQEEAFGRGQVMWFNKPADLSMLYAAPPQRPAQPVQEPVQEAVCRNDGMPTSAEERHLRRLLALRAAMPHAYYDDGEAQGTEHGISIDFMREPVAHIDAKLRALNVARAIAKQSEPVQEPAPMPPFPPVSLWKRGCAVCGIGAGGHAYGYACPRSDCPTRVTCGGTV